MLLARGAAVAEILLAGAPWQSDCREAEPWQSCWLGRCCRVAGRGAVAELLAGSAMARGCAVAKMLLPGRSIGKREKQHARTKSRIGKNMLLSFQMNKI